MFSPAQIELLTRTVSRVPEVMVKVSGGAKSSKGAIAHLQYIDRRGRLEIETDDGQTLSGRGAAIERASSWDLDAAASQNRTPYRGKAGRVPVKLVHNVVFSMPRGTPPDKLVLAVRAFAREKFALQHRYAMVLHTDQDHPHVHLVIKALSEEEGRRLNIRKGTLREWRSHFALQLRAHGVAANATERAVRGQNRLAFKSDIYRATKRGEPRYLRERVTRIARELRDGGVRPAPGKAKLVETRNAVVAGWRATADALLQAGHSALAEKIWGFIGDMRPPRSTDEQLTLQLLQRVRVREPGKESQRIAREAIGLFAGFDSGHDGVLRRQAILVSFTSPQQPLNSPECPQIPQQRAALKAL
jgi:hypothetical protein